MKTDLDHLPATKQRELERVVQLLFEEFDGAHMDATGRRKTGRSSRFFCTAATRAAAG